jgi:hypothetical protein
MGSFWDDVWGTLFDPDGPAQDAAHDFADKHDLPDLTGSGSGAIDAITDSVSMSKLIWLNLSDHRMWRSLGWLMLGIVLMLVGFVVWSKKTTAALGAARAAL